MLNRLNSLLCLFSVIFVLIFSMVYGAASADIDYFKTGKQVTIPDFNEKVDSSETFTRSIYRLAGWDGHWYYHIAEKGYRTTWPPTAQNPELSNVAFFPGYPLLVRAFSSFLSIPLAISLPLFSQLAYIVAFTVLLLFYRKEMNTDFFSYLPLLLFLAGPGSFFYLCGYSESLFSLLLTCFLITCIQFERTQDSKWMILAILSGFLLTATRLTGLPMVTFPVLLILLKGSKKFSKPALIAILSLLGGLSFFLFCALKFGHWNTYFATGSIGWGRKISYTDPFAPWTMINSIRFAQRPLDAINNWMGLGLYVVLAVEFIRNIILLLKKNNEVYLQLSVLLVAIGMFYLTLSATLPHNNQGMVRYSLPVITTLIVYWGIVHLQIPTLQRKAFLLLLLPLLYLSLQMQLEFVTAFISGYIIA